MSIEDMLRQIVREEFAKLRAELAAPPRDEYLSTAAAARFASVAPGTLRRWIKEGRLTGQRAGRVVRIRRADLEQLLRSGRSRAANSDLTPAERAERDFG